MCTSPALLLLVSALLGAATSHPAAAASGALAPTAKAADADAPPSSDEPLEDVRVVLLSHGSAAFLRAANKLLEMPLAAEVEVMPSTSYKRAATQAHIRKANSIAAVQRLARFVHITHVVSIAETRAGPKGDRRRFVEVVVARFKPTTTVLMAQRFLMPDHKLTATLAGVLKERIQQALESPTPEAGPREPRRGDSGGRGSGDGDNGDDADTDTDEDSLEASTDEAQDPKAGEGRIWAALGPALGKRAATLSTTSPAAGAPPCYCGGTALANTFLGIHAEASAFWAASGTAVGVVGDLTVLFANTVVPLDVTKRTVSSVVTEYEAGAALRWQTPVELQLTPMLGYHAFAFPLTDGPFPGLSYNSLWAAVRLGLDLGDGMWNIFLQADVLPILGAHDEATRLGKQTRGVGWGVSGGVRVMLPWVEAALRLRFVDHGLTFSGKTFLYTPIRYNDVSLDDRMGELVLMVGSHFW